MSDVTQTVETVFAVNGAPAASAYAAVGQSAAAAGRAISGAMGAGLRFMRSMGGMVTPLRALIGGVAGGMGVRALIEMHSQAEGMRQAIAGTLTAFGAVNTFRDGMQVTAGLMDQINRDAAALPGSAEDYAQTFRTALPAAMSAGFHSLSEIATFTNHMTAVAVANQEDAEQAGMDMMRLLQGQAGAHVRLWHTLQPLIGQTAQQFNALTAPQRAERMQHALQQYAPLLAEMGNTWDAIYGTTQQYVVQIGRAATMPIFDAAKGALQHLNTWIDQNSNAITHMGQAFSRFLVDNLDPIDGRIREIINRFNTGVVQRHAMGIVETVRGQIGTGPGAGAGAAGAVASIAARVLFGPLGGIFMFFATHMEVLNQVIDMLTPAIQPAIQIFQLLSAIFTDAMESLIPPMATLISAVLPAFASVLGDLQPHLQALFEAVGQLITAFAPLAATLITALSPALQVFVDGLTGIAEMLHDLVDWARAHIPGLGSATSSLSGLVQGFSAVAKPGAHAPLAAAPPPTAEPHIAMPHLPSSRGGHHTHNDFRYSRFDIQQRFAEGMDPDRVGIAFTTDLERSADMRLQGQLEPSFTQR